MGSTIQFYDLHPPQDDFLAEVVEGLSQSPKAISPKFLYDKRGAELFDDICQLEEYYLTRTEMQILQTHAQEIAGLMGDSVLMEFGSGSSQKIRILLDADPEIKTYVGLDISKQHLRESCESLAQLYPDLEVMAVCADFTSPITLPGSLQDRPKVGFFPGSSIGNVPPEEALQMLSHFAQLLGAGGNLIIGVDLKKDAAVLEPAYQDSQGVSAAFALNLLTRINRELGADFKPDQFDYQASYNPLGRIEMVLVSQQPQTIHVQNQQFGFAQGETLRTEFSYKYTVTEFQELAAAAGFYPKTLWMDPKGWFSIHYLTT